MKNKKMKNLVITSLILLALIIVLLLVYAFLPKNIFTPYETVKKTESIRSTDIAGSPAVGWVRVQGTNVDYPVIYETPAAYQSGKDYTWVAARPGTTDNRMVIYGHNVQNISSKPMIGNSKHIRFEQLMAFVYEDFAQNNLYFQYSDETGDYLYKIYAISFVEDNEQGAMTQTKEETKAYIEEAKRMSLYKYDVEVNEEDTLVSLITCTRYFGAEEKKQFRIDGRKVRANENTEKYTVHKTKNYDIIK